MGLALKNALFSVLSAAILGGCHSPSDQIRHESFTKHQEGFSGNRETAQKLTYIILSGRSRFNADMDPKTGEVHWFAGKQSFATGLAVGIERDGYLITAAHAL